MKHQALFASVRHRPYPPPVRPWVMFQRWVNLLFAHWPLPVEVLQAMIPPSLKVDTFEDQGWLGIVPFQMCSVHPRFTLPLPALSYFPELNVRTYVVNRVGDDVKPGVWFFSLDAGNFIAVWLARLGYRLPYFHADMHVSSRGVKIGYTSRRRHPGARPAEFMATYYPTGACYHAAPGSLDYWLTERYCLYTSDRQGNLFRGEIHHPPWPLQRAEAEFRSNTMARAAGIELPDLPPLLHFAGSQPMIAWYLQRVEER